MAGEIILNRLNQHEIHLNERLGQHILIDPEWLAYIGALANPGAHVVEIGAGPGNLTEQIAARTRSVTAIELDPRFEPLLQEVTNQYPHVKVVIADALAALPHLIDPNEPLQIMGNIPYHITEPLMHMFPGLPFENAILTVGDNLSTRLRSTSPYGSDFTRLSLLSAGFFDVDLLAEIPKSAFYPAPRTESHLVQITPKDEPDDPYVRIIRQLFLSGDSTSVGNIIEFALQSEISKQTGSKPERHRYERRVTKRGLRNMMQDYNLSPQLPQASRLEVISAKDPLSRLRIPKHILSSRFSSLTNSDLRTLAQAILEIYPNR